MREKRQPSIDAAGALIVAQLKKEHGRMRGALHQARTQRNSTDQAIHGALNALEGERQSWRDLYAAIAAAVGIAAASNLIAQWQSSGDLAADYPAYDPGSDHSTALAGYINSDAPSAGDATVDATRSSLWDILRDAAVAGGILSLIDALDSTYGAWTGSDGLASAAANLSGDEGALAGTRAGVLATNSVIQPWTLSELGTAADVTADDNPDAPVGPNGQALLAIKTWVCAMLPNSREWHIEADGQQVALEATFSVGGEDLDGPGDGSGMNSNNCCCSMLIELAPASTPLDSETGDTSGDSSDFIEAQ